MKRSDYRSLDRWGELARDSELEGERETAGQGDTGEGRAERILHRISPRSAGVLLQAVPFLTSEVALFKQGIAERMKPYARQVDLLMSIPGVKQMGSVALRNDLFSKYLAPRIDIVPPGAWCHAVLPFQ
jgi:hypothetical protein